MIFTSFNERYPLRASQKAQNTLHSPAFSISSSSPPSSYGLMWFTFYACDSYGCLFATAALSQRKDISWIKRNKITKKNIPRVGVWFLVLSLRVSVSDPTHLACCMDTCWLAATVASDLHKSQNYVQKFSWICDGFIDLWRDCNRSVCKHIAFSWGKGREKKNSSVFPWINNLIIPIIRKNNINLSISVILLSAWINETKFLKKKPKIFSVLMAQLSN